MHQRAPSDPQGYKDVSVQQAAQSFLDYTLHLESLDSIINQN